MALIGDMQYLTIGGNTYSIPVGGSTVQVVQNLTSGTKTATITVDGTPYELFAPSTVTETDPVFSASAAAGITSTDISNWNSKVSDDKTWNGVTLNNTTLSGSTIYIPARINGTDTNAYNIKASTTPTSSAIGVAMYNSSGYLNSTTPSANDNSTKVATTAYVDAAIPDVSGFSTTDEKLKVFDYGSAVNQYYPIFGEANNTASTKRYSTNFRIKNYNSEFELQIGQVSSNPTRGTIKLVSNQSQGYIILQTEATDYRTITLPDKTGTIALTSDIPTVSYPVTSVNTKTGAVNLTASDVGAMSTSHAANAITATDISNWNAKADSDVNVTNTAVTAATTYYLTGSTNSSTATGGLSKHAAIKAYVTANSGTGGSARIDLGNTTATTSAGGKEGIVRLYGTSATYYVDIKAGAPSANRTITLPNKTGTVALTSDIPTVPTITLNGTSTTTPSFYAPTTAGTNGYFLKSNGSGAPTWAAIDTTAAQIVRW